jgi:hypothetical protein
MTAQELQKRNEKAQKLRVIQVDDGSYFVESSEGKICYRVSMDDGEVSCTCGDFARNIRQDANFRCKHIVSVQNCVSEGDLENGTFLERKKPKLDERFITTIEGKDFVMYPGLLDLGHQKGILKIEVEPMQLPTKENGHFAVCKALVVSSNGETFTDVGDANPENCNSRIAKHLLRMASTRAIARALRSFTNIGMTCLEELGDLNDVIGQEKSIPQRREPRPIRRKGNGRDVKPAAPEKTSQQEKAAKPGNGDKPAGQSEEKVKESRAQRPQAAPRKAETPQAQPRKVQEPEPQVQTETKETKDQSQVPKMSEAQKRAIYNLSRRRGISVDDLEKRVQETYQVPLEELPSKDASEFIRTLQQAA